MCVSVLPVVSTGCGLVERRRDGDTGQIVFMVPGLEQFLQSVIKDIYSYQKKDT